MYTVQEPKLIKRHMNVMMFSHENMRRVIKTNLIRVSHHVDCAVQACTSVHENRLSSAMYVAKVCPFPTLFHLTSPYYPLVIHICV